MKSMKANETGLPKISHTRGLQWSGRHVSERVSVWTCAFFLFCFLAPFEAAAAAEVYVRGVVFHDRDGTGARGAGDEGIPGVMVSNGDAVVRTDAEGRYVLPARENRSIFVIKPAGWTLPVDDNGLPVFYYNHVPEGSPPLFYGGVDPTGPLPESVDFPLRRGEAAEDFTVLLVADPQVRHLDQVGYYRKLVVEELAERTDYEFGIVLGDMVANDLGMFGPYIEVNRRIPRPVYHVLGNHDIDRDAPDERSGDDTYNRHFGPSTYAFEHGKAFFFVLNNVRFPVDADPGGRVYVGGFADDVIRFVENTLRHVPVDRLIVLNMHIPLLLGIPGVEDRTFRMNERRRLLRLFRDRPNVIALAGHLHYQQHIYIGEEGGWPGLEPLHMWVVGTASGSHWSGAPDERGVPDSMMPDGVPPGYGFLHISGTDYRFAYKAAGYPEDHQMRFTAPRHIITGERNLPMYVNVFNGCARTTVEFRVLPGGDWHPMQRRWGFDPYYQGRRLWERDESESPPEGTRLPPPVLTSHLWQARVPRELEPGEYTLEARATDPWGRTFTARRKVGVHPVEHPYGRLSRGGFEPPPHRQ